MKNSLLLILFLAASDCLAGLIVIDPNEYVAGVDLSSISPHVTFSTTDGGAVYAAALPAHAAGGKHTKGFGKHVFSAKADEASEWWIPEWGAPGLEITFHLPVTYFSLLVAELFHDAGPGSDPVYAFIFDRNNNLLTSLYVDEFNHRVDLGFIDEDQPATWAYWNFEYSAANIGKIIIGGDSEPTSFGRFKFAYAEVPEPITGVLLLIGLLGIWMKKTFPKSQFFISR